MTEVDPWDNRGQESQPSAEMALPALSQEIGFIALADNYTMPIARVDPAKEVESVQREAIVQREIMSLAQPYYGLAANVLRDERYQKQVTSSRRGSKKPVTGSAEWVFVPETTDQFKDNYTYRFAVDYNTAQPFEPTRLTVGVSPRFVEGGELFQFGIGFHDQTATYAFLSGRRPRYRKAWRTWDRLDSPMFTLGCLMSREDKKRYPDLICGKLNSKAEDMLSAPDEAQVDMVFGFGRLPMTVEKRIQSDYKWAGWRNREEHNNRYTYNRLTDSFDLDDVRIKTSIPADDVTYAFSVMLGLIPINRL